MKTSLRTMAVSRILFPLHEKLKGHVTTAMLRRLEQSQWWTPDAIERFRLERLKSFLTDVGTTVPYYRELFARVKFAPASVASLADLARLPLLTKPIIRDNLEAFKADGHRHLTRYSTGGSSGEPLILYIGRHRKSHDVAAKWRATRWWGVDVGDPELVVWGSPIELRAQDRLRRWRDSLMRSELLPAFEMSLVNLDRYVCAIRAVRPAMLFGYPSSLALIAEHAAKTGVALNDLGIRVVFVTAERLYPEQRRMISERFGCPVANGYGARDAGFIAHECPAGSLHISAEDLIVETIHADGTATKRGEPGEIVVTHLATGDFPLVRYRTGDVGVLSTDLCACGRGLPVLAEVQGRTTDFVVARNGTIMHGLALIYTLRDVPGLERFRIVQQSLDLTEVEIVTNAVFGPAQETRIVRELKARLGGDVAIVLSRVAEIRPEASGKYRYVTSKVASMATSQVPTHADS